MNPTKEQEAFVQTLLEKHPCFLSARAGTGKTTTIKLGIEALLESGVPPQEISAIAFNKMNQEDLAKALPLDVRVSTLHSLGYAAVRRFLPRTDLNTDKVFKILSSAGIRGKNARDTFKDTLRLVGAAKAWGLVPLLQQVEHKSQGATSKGLWKEGLLPDTKESWEELIEHFELWDADIIKARDVLKESNSRALKAGEIDFDDMTYLPVALGLKILAPDILIVDEAQDLSPLNLEMLRNIPSKIWLVGDPYQAIYAWRGASAQGLRDFISERDLPVLPLTNCWRCSGEIISEAKKVVRDIWTENPPGLPVTHRTSLPEFEKLEPGTILARNNSTLVKIALELRSAGKPVCILGKELVKTLGGILDKLKGTNSKTLKESLLSWKEKMLAKYPHQDGQILDYASCLEVILDEVSGTQAAKKLLGEIFLDEPRNGCWILSTIHKAKGKEFEKVWLFDWEKKGEQGWMKEEERNLEYVAITRAKSQLIRIPQELLELQSKKTEFKLGDEDIYSSEGELLSSPTREDGLWD